MAFLPKSAGDIMRQLKSAVRSRSKLSDINAGSGLMILLQAFAEELASTERRMFTVRESFFLNGSLGADLDRRVAELPPVGISRIDDTRASGTVMRFERDIQDTSELIIIPAGTLIQSTTGTRYRTTVDVVMPIGDADVDNVHIIAESAGVGGNTPINSITRMINAPTQLTACRNTQPLTNGLDRETDTALKLRAMDYLKSLSRCQKASIEFMARSFVSSEGERFPYAKVYEDPEQLGFCELVIDDGSGISKEALSRAGQTAMTNIATGGSRVAYHEAPATGPITPDMIRIHLGGNPATQIAPQEHNYTSLWERGVVYLKEGVANPDDVVVITNYRVYRGYVAELQQEIEGDPNTFDRMTGFRSAGTRVVVNTVTPQYINLDIALTVEPTSDYNVVEYAVKTAIETFVNKLAPSESLFISSLVDVAVGVTGTRDVQFYERNSTTRANNIDTSTALHALRVKEGSILITTSTI